MSVTADALMHNIRFDMTQLDKEFDTNKVKEQIEHLYSFIAKHADKFSRIFEEYQKKYSDPNITVMFVHHKNKAILSSAEWNGTERIIRIAIDYGTENITHAFLIEILNATNPAEINDSYTNKVIKQTKIVFSGQQVTAESVANNLIAISKEFGISQETREFYATQAYSLFLEEQPRTLDAYLKEQDEPSEQCHGFSHTETYQYRFLLLIVKTLPSYIEIEKTKKSEGQELCLEAVKKRIEEYIQKMRLDAEETLRDKSLNKEFLAGLAYVTKLGNLRFELLEMHAKLRRLGRTPENAPVLVQFNERVQEVLQRRPNLATLDKESLPLCILDVSRKSRFSLEEDTVLLENMRKQA